VNADQPPSKVERAVHRALEAFLHFERRFEPFFRPGLNRLLREPSARFLQRMIDKRRADDGLALAEEKPLPGEDEALDSIIGSMTAYSHQHYQPGGYLRTGNTKTHGIVRGELIVRDDIPENMKRGVFAQPQSYRAWVRFSGPGPDTPPDIEDVGFVSCAFKLMGVPGPKLLEDEKHTQDFLSVCTPTFVTPNVVANADLQKQILRGTPLFYFFTPGRIHILDFLMQAWWNETQTNPLEARYWSCVPYLLGEGQAMMYSMRPRGEGRSRVPRAPLRPPDNYLRDNMVATLNERDVDLDLMVQVQTDPHRMPLENAAVRWPEELSPFVPVATLHIPKQKFDSPAQFAFAHTLSLNPWHCIAEHRPLGNQSRARRRMYYEMSKLRQKLNKTPHAEPTGDEVFD
jgi:hypothetical protein